MNENLAAAEHAARARLMRSLASMTVGFDRSRSKAKAEVASLEPGDMAHGIQLDLKGVAGNVMATWDLPVTWTSAPFLTRLQVADDDETTPVNPQFGFGYELRTDSPVMVSAAVREWRQNDKGLIDSALVRLMAVSPGASVAVAFQAVAHLTFTGYAAPSDDDDDGAATAAPSPDWPSGGTDNLTMDTGWGGTGG
jgi:hypothetical protein